MNKTLQSQNKKLEKHKLTSSCFNTCIEWKLNASISQNKHSLGFIFLGKSLFFRKLEASILNTMQVNYSSLNNSNSTEKNLFKEFEEKSESQLKESKTQPYTDDKEDDILSIKFPIDNSEFNFMILDANLGITENLKNLFFLEFDLSNTLSNKEKLKFLREINNECVEREIFFVLNGYIHGSPIFKKEINFSVETRKFIKSMQFRLETYKHESYERKYRNKNFRKIRMQPGIEAVNSEKNLNICNLANTSVSTVKNIFFTKILSNTNIGIEFIKPTFEPGIENFATNFNSIVNSNILINKIYLEVCIPKIFINNGLTLNLTSKKEKEKEMIVDKNQPIIINETIQNAILKKESEFSDQENIQKLEGEKALLLSDNTNSSTFQTESLYYHKLGVGSNSSSNPISNLMNNRKNTFAYSTYNNPSNNIFNNSAKQFSSKPSSPSSSLRNGLGIPIHNINLNNISQMPQISHLRSPESVRKASNISLGLGMGYLNNPMYLNPTISSGVPSPRSIDGSSASQHNMHTMNINNNLVFPVHPQYSMHPLNNFNRNTHNSRRLSESTYDKLKDNPLNMLNQGQANANCHGRMQQNMIRSPQMYMKVNPEMIIPNINPMGNIGGLKPNFINSFSKNMQNMGTGNFSSSNSFITNGFVSPRDYSNVSQNQMLRKNINLNNPIKNIDMDVSNPKSNKLNDEDKNDCGVSSEGESLQKTHFSHVKKNKQIQRMNLLSLTSQYEGYCNFLIFLKSCTPHVLKKDSNLITNLTLYEYFKSFDKISAFGLDVTYYSENDLINTTYSPTLSSLEIQISNKEICTLLIDDLTKIHKHTNHLQLKSIFENDSSGTSDKGSEYEFLIGDSNLNFIIKNYSIKIEFYEHKPPHSRQILSNQIGILFDSFETLKNISLERLDQNSWFSILWSPMKSSKSSFMSTSFITYYKLIGATLRENIIKGSLREYSELSIIGVLPIKFENKLFLSRIINMNSISNNFQYPLYIENTCLLKSSIDNVFNMIIMNCNRTSMDYEFYLKYSITFN